METGLVIVLLRYATSLVAYLGGGQRLSLRDIYTAVFVGYRKDQGIRPADSKRRGVTNRKNIKKAGRTSRAFFLCIFETGAPEGEVRHKNV